MRRVVITGIGLVTPFGCGIQPNWSQLIEGKSAIRQISSFDTSDLSCHIAGLLPTDDANPYAFKAEDWIAPKEIKKFDPYNIYALAASTMALKDSGWVIDNEEKSLKTGVTIGSGIGGIGAIANTSITLHEKGPRRVSPFFIPSSLINMASGLISIEHNIKGPNHAVVTACSSSAHAIIDATRMIQVGDADVMVAGGTESSVTRIGIAGFCSARALNTQYNDNPEQASRPWDQDRCGFVMSEGAGIVIVEEYEHAVKRGAPIYAEITGYGLTGDAHHITSPAPDGNGGYRSMVMALQKAKCNIEDINYINAHSTSTPTGDEIELASVQSLFGNSEQVNMSSTKSSIGHLLGAAGAVEAIYTILSMKHNILPPTINLDSPPSGNNINLVPNYAQNHEVNMAMSNSFGFGGTNATLVFKKI